MKIKAVPSAWLTRNGRRLDCGPYLLGSLEAEIRIESMRTRQQLRRITAGYSGGIYYGPQFRRNYVESPEHGVRFLTGGDILKADLSDLPLLRKRDALSSKLSHLRLSPGMTLISCSGAIGRMAYVRRDMDGIWSSQDVLKVVPDESKIPPGYLFAYLSSRFGRPLVVGGTYGAIIQRIEPEHIAEILVPRLSARLEGEVHAAVEKTARLRERASQQLIDATHAVSQALGPPLIHGNQHEDRRVGQSVACSRLDRTRRFEAFFFNPVAQELDRWASKHANGKWSLGEIADVFDVPPFKHIYVEPEYGVPFFTSGDLFLLERSTEKHLSKSRTRDLQKYILERGWVLLARSGQLGGIIGRPQFADSAMSGAAASDHVIRIVPRDKMVPPGYLFAYLATQSIGYSFLTRTMTGASVPALWPVYLNDVLVVKANERFMDEIDRKVQDAFELRIDATKLERTARRLVEDAIEGGG